MLLNQMLSPQPRTTREFEDLARPQRVMERQLSAFAPHERKRFLAMLDKFTRAFNESTRVPLAAHRQKAKDGTKKR